MLDSDIVIHVLICLTRDNYRHMRGPLLVYIKKFRSFIDFINKLQFPYQHQKFLMIIVPGQLKVFGFFFNVHATTVLLTTGSTKVDLESEGKHISCRNEHWFFPPSSTPVLKMCHLPLCCYCLKWTSNEKVWRTTRPNLLWKEQRKKAKKYCHYYTTCSRGLYVLLMYLCVIQYSKLQWKEGIFM